MESPDTKRYDTDLERESAEYYEQRWRFLKKLNAGDWWIAVAVYLLLCSVAFVVL